MDCMSSMLQSVFSCACDPVVGYDYFEGQRIIIDYDNETLAITWNILMMFLVMMLSSIYLLCYFHFLISFLGKKLKEKNKNKNLNYCF